MDSASSESSWLSTRSVPSWHGCHVPNHTRFCVTLSLRHRVWWLFLHTRTLWYNHDHHLLADWTDEGRSLGHTGSGEQVQRYHLGGKTMRRTKQQEIRKANFSTKPHNKPCVAKWAMAMTPKCSLKENNSCSTVSFGQRDPIKVSWEVYISFEVSVPSRGCPLFIRVPQRDLKWCDIYRLLLWRSANYSLSSKRATCRGPPASLRRQPPVESRKHPSLSAQLLPTCYCHVQHLPKPPDTFLVQTLGVCHERKLFSFQHPPVAKCGISQISSYARVSHSRCAECTHNEILPVVWSLSVMCVWNVQVVLLRVLS